MSQRKCTRRQLLKSSASLAVPFIVPTSVLGRDGPSPNDRINFGVIGLGGRGLYLLNSLLSNAQVRVTAICDVHQEHYRDNPWGKGFAMGRLGGQQLVENLSGYPLWEAAQ